MITKMRIGELRRAPRFAFLSRISGRGRATPHAPRRRRRGMPADRQNQKGRESEQRAPNPTQPALPLPPPMQVRGITDANFLGKLDLRCGGCDVFQVLLSRAARLRNPLERNLIHRARMGAPIGRRDGGGFGGCSLCWCQRLWRHKEPREISRQNRISNEC